MSVIKYRKDRELKECNLSMIMPKLNILIILSTLIFSVSCITPKFENIKQEEAKVCSDNGLEKIDCMNEIAHSLYAYKYVSCDKTPSSYFAGQCQLVTCESGFTQVGNFCLPNSQVSGATSFFICNPGDVSTVSCISEKPGSFSASKTRECNKSGTGYLYGNCQVTSCANTHFHDASTNTCIPKKCLLGSQKRIACSNPPSNSYKSYQLQQCNDESVGFENVGSCVLESCYAGYYTDTGTNLCVPMDATVGKVCVPGKGLTVSCAENVGTSDAVTGVSIGNKLKICNSDGKSFTSYDCNITKCNESTHNLTRDGTGKLTCTPKLDCSGLPANEDCTSDVLPFIPALSGYPGVATKLKSCDSKGSNYLYTSCKIQSCDNANNYYLVDGTCLYVDPSNKCSAGTLIQDNIDCSNEINYASSAKKKKYCNDNGIGYRYTQCVLESCNSGYNSDFNQCLPQSCIPGEYLTEDCSEQKVHSAQATVKFRCNTSGNGYDLSQACQIISCESGYVNVYNECQPIVCPPGAIDTPVSCVDEIANSTAAERVNQCNSSGTEVNTAPICRLISCEDDYNPDFSVNQCVAKACRNTPLESPTRWKKESCTSEIPNSSLAYRHSFCNFEETGYIEDGRGCVLESCLEGYTLNAAKDKCLVAYEFEGDKHIFVDEGSDLGFKRVSYTLSRSASLNYLQDIIVTMKVTKESRTEKLQGHTGATSEDSNIFHTSVSTDGNETLIKKVLFTFDPKKNSYDGEIDIKQDLDDETENKIITLEVLEDEGDGNLSSVASSSPLTIHITEDDSDDIPPRAICEDSIYQVHDYKLGKVLTVDDLVWNGGSSQFNNIKKGSMISFSFKPEVGDIGYFQWFKSPDLSDDAFTEKIVSITQCKGIAGRDALDSCRVSAKEGIIRYQSVPDKNADLYTQSKDQNTPIYTGNSTAVESTLPEPLDGHCIVQQGETYYVSIQSGKDENVSDHELTEFDTCPEGETCNITVLANRNCNGVECEEKPRFIFTNPQGDQLRITSIMEGGSPFWDGVDVPYSLNSATIYMKRVAGPADKVNIKIDTSGITDYLTYTDVDNHAVLAPAGPAYLTEILDSASDIDYYIDPSQANFTFEADETFRSFQISVIMDNFDDNDPTDVFVDLVNINYTFEYPATEEWVAGAWTPGTATFETPVNPDDNAYLFIYDDEPDGAPVCDTIFLNPRNEEYRVTLDSSKILPNGDMMKKGEFLAVKLNLDDIQFQGYTGGVKISYVYPAEGRPLTYVLSDCPAGSLKEAAENNGECIFEGTGDGPGLIEFIMLKNAKFTKENEEDPSVQSNKYVEMDPPGSGIEIPSPEGKCKLQKDKNYYVFVFAGDQEDQNQCSDDPLYNNCSVNFSVY